MNSIAAHQQPSTKESAVALYVTILLFVLSLAVSAFSAYGHNDKELAQRISVVETQQKNDGGRFDRIERKLETIEAKLDRVVENTRKRN